MRLAEQQVQAVYMSWHALYTGPFSRRGWQEKESSVESQQLEKSEHKICIEQTWRKTKEE